jgi:hypothetical protein
MEIAGATVLLISPIGDDYGHVMLLCSRAQAERDCSTWVCTTMAGGARELQLRRINLVILMEEEAALLRHTIPP